MLRWDMHCIGNRLGLVHLLMIDDVAAEPVKHKHLALVVLLRTLPSKSSTCWLVLVQKRSAQLAAVHGAMLPSSTSNCV